MLEDRYQNVLITCGWVLAAIALAVLGTWIVRRLRGRNEQARLPSDAALTNFREMHERGVLSDAEFRTIKTALATQIQREIKENAETG